MGTTERHCPLRTLLRRPDNCGVADKIPDRIAALVYVDAGIPEDGKSTSTLDLLSAPQQASFLNIVADHGGQMVPPFPAEFFGVNPADRAMVDALCTPQPFATLCERPKLTGAYMNIPKKTYVRATNWEATHLQGVYARLKDDRTLSVVEVPCGHDVMLDAPTGWRRFCWTRCERNEFMKSNKCDTGFVAVVTCLVCILNVPTAWPSLRIPLILQKLGASGAR